MGSVTCESVEMWIASRYVMRPAPGRRPCSNNLTLYWHNDGMHQVPDGPVHSLALPFAGLRVVTTANALPTAVVGQVLADAGADVWLLEPPGGSKLRTHPAWAFWA